MRNFGFKSGALAVLMTLGVGMETPSTTLAETPAPRTQRLLERGPYGSGTATLNLEDKTRPTMETTANVPNVGLVTCPASASRKLDIEVWYPAKDDAQLDIKNAPIGKSKDGFPLIVYGHGLGSSNLDISHVASHLASYGYVVASIKFPLSNGKAPCGPTAIDVEQQVGDMLYTRGALTTFFAPAFGVDATRTALMGYSLGGVTAAMATDFATSVGIKITAVATLAPAACGLYTVPEGYDAVNTSLKRPLMVIGGTTDLVTPLADNGAKLFGAAEAATPKYLVTITNGSHLGFISTAAGYESLYPTTALDNVICSGLVQAGYNHETTAAECAPCPRFPSTALRSLQLPSTRQHDLERAALLAFFDGYMRDERRDQQYLKTGLQGENTELTVTYEGPANQ